MSTTISTVQPSPAPSMAAEVLRRLEFSRHGTVYHRGDLRFDQGGEWISFSRPATRREDPLAAIGRPGLWKLSGGGRSRRWMFRLPTSLLREEEGCDEVEENSPDQCGTVPLLEMCLMGVIATMTGEATEDWNPPGEETLASWIHDRKLTIQHGSTVRQIEVIREPRRFALRVALVTGIPDQLNEVRRQWLRALLDHAQRSWHLVRTGLTEDGLAVAEVDLTGIPEALQAPLFGLALDSLRWVVSGLGETAEFLVDPGTTSQVLELWPPTGGRKQK